MEDSGHLSGLKGHLSGRQWTFEWQKNGHMSKMKINLLSRLPLPLAMSKITQFNYKSALA